MQLIKTEQQQFEKWVLTAEGSEVVKSGSHEARVYNAVDKKDGTSQAEIMASVGVSLLTSHYSVNARVGNGELKMGAKLYCANGQSYG